MPSRRVWIRSACAAIAAALACSAPAGAATIAPQGYGFNDVSWTNLPIPHAVAKAEMAKAHAKYWRFSVSWQYFEPQPGQVNGYYFKYIMDEYQQTLANGQTPVVIVLGTPYWALTPAGRGASKGPFLCADNNNATICDAPPDVRRPDIDTSWRNYLSQLAYFMPKAVLEIWNEPNLDWGWMQPQDPELYGLMLKSAGTAIHAINPTATVLSGSVNPYSGPDTSSNTGYQSFLRKMYATAGAASFNALGFHAYPCNDVPTTSGWTSLPNRILTAVRGERDAAHDYAKPLWLTETGASTGAAACGPVFTEAQQGPALGAVLTWAKSQNASRRDLPVVLVNSLFDFRPRTAPGVPIATVDGEWGMIAYTIDSTTGLAKLVYKPALATITCKFAGTC